MSTSTVLLVGGTGVFGSRLALGLLKEPGLEVVVAGRDLGAAEAFCRRHGGSPMQLDRTAPDLAEQVAALAPAIVIDAAGPFQDYGAEPYRLAESALACGSHYLDLSDDAAFTEGIVALDGGARARGVTLLSGVSSVPALSSAAVEELRRGLADIQLIESVILPGNRAPRGLSVIRSILAQAGQPLRVWQGGRWTEARGWSRLRRERLEVPGATPLPVRWSSLIGAPDLRLFPQRYGARSVLFRAGLELPLLHHGLGALAALVRLGCLPSLERWAGPMRWAAGLVERLGTDRGGMEVRVLGTTPDGTPLRRRWTLVAEAGDGPHVPALAARALCRKLLAGRVPPGARPCLGEVALEEVAAAASGLRVTFAQSEASEPLLFATALGNAFPTLPAPVRDLHAVLYERRWEGRATVTRGGSALARLICAAVGFPKAGEDLPVSVRMRRRGAIEVWERTFAGRRFRSVLSLAGPPGSGLVHERFGPFRFVIELAVDAEGLRYPVRRGNVLGLPLPRFLLPRSETLEGARPGCATFDVAISLPWIGEVVRYRGSLRPADTAPSGEARTFEALPGPLLRA